MNYFYGMKRDSFTQPTGNMKEYCDILESPNPLEDKDEFTEYIVEYIIDHYKIEYLGCGDTLEEAQGKMLGALLGKKLNLRR